MNRRSAIRNFVFITAGVVFIPSCRQDAKPPSVQLKNLKLDADDEALIAELSETIIPKTDRPGAKDVAAHQFVLNMVDDCYEKSEQSRFSSGMKAFNDRAKNLLDKGFVQSSIAERAPLMEELEKAKGEDSDLQFFYKTTKGLTIQAYTGSKYYLTSVQVYELVPGRFNGCVPVSKQTTLATN